MLLIGHVANGEIQEIVSEERITALGRDLDRTRQLHPQSMQDTRDALKDYFGIIERNGLVPREALVTATEAARVATNAKDFFRELEECLGFRIHIITAEGEAYYTLRGVIEDDNKPTVIMDIGGASTELIKVSGCSLEKMVSLPVGSVRGSDWAREGSFEVRLKDILADVDLRMASFQALQVVGVGGTMTSLAAMCKNVRNFEAGELEDCSIGYHDLEELLERIEKQSEERLHENFPFLGERVRSIKTGGRLALMVGGTLGVRTWKISTRGLRHGILAEGRIDGRFLA